ncbi:Cthe_2314 family HEPN domain-containing protein [Pontimicrobium aquaticum]|uniref:Cthe-2314-like HEPN domain-containing protein n=1 Tax=Pontimicrobium aquaticum TaxID=2565367 RepID=A0A4U0EZT2_9FLAO|nr:Cthe_2314 family HEPN domain-containing protein [Pontimicrobium aquaticum]TJY35892.1 hypothetical protein E5167_08470 [Pontimicrobium aquaticum]
MGHIENHYSEVSKFFSRENLISLSDNEHNYNGLNTMQILHLEKVNPNFEKFNKFKNLSDLKNCNNDLKLLTANLYLYHPHINNPLKEFKIIREEKIFTYFQNGYDWIYSTFVSCCYEKLYNYWDRIGDTLAYYLELDIPEFRVGFASAIDKMISMEIYNSNENFEFLRNFKSNEFREFNKHRKDVVHYYQFETTYKHEIEENFNNEEEIEKLWNWKNNMPNYFKNHLNLSCIGFVKTYELIKKFS